MDEDKKSRICLEVLKQGYRKIYFELRFLEQALFRLIPEEKEEIFFGSDGEKLYYGREYLLTRYLQSPEAVSCDYLHTVIHCLYQHPFQACGWEGRYWNLAADIAVADVLSEIDVVWIFQQIPQECLEIADRIRQEVPVMSAFHIAAFLRNEFSEVESLSGYCFGELEELFRRDSHVCWKSGQEEEGKVESEEKAAGEEADEAESEESVAGEEADEAKSEESAGGGEADEAESEESVAGEEVDEAESEERAAGGEANEVESEERTGRGEADEAELEESAAGRGAHETEPGNTAGGNGGRTDAGRRWPDSKKQSQLSEEWKEIGEAVALNAGSFSKGQGKVPGSMLLTIQRLTREQYDYGEFLRKFAVMNERMKVNMEEFDYTYYLYGLHLLGKIPLIEPLEYKEELQIREFVIVIDTSGSCSGDLVERFLNKTYNILSQMKCFAQQIVLHIIQCDAAVQDDVRIKCAEHMEEYIAGMEFKGGGGTDFRPAFAYEEELRGSGEFKRLCGMLYFTDGYGTFPERPPDYKTAFVFVEREDAVRVPPWAMCIYLDTEPLVGAL